MGVTFFAVPKRVIIYRIPITVQYSFSKPLILTNLSKKYPSSKVGDELRRTLLDQYIMICYYTISRNRKKLIIHGVRQ